MSEIDLCVRHAPYRHWHESYQMIVVVSGRLVIQTGRRRIDLNPGRVYVIPPRAEHYPHETQDGEWVTYIDVRLFEESHPAFVEAVSALIDAPATREGWAVPRRAVNELRHDFADAVTDGRPSQGARIMAALWRFVASFPSDATPIVSPAPSEFGDPRLEVLAGMIRATLAQEITLDYLAGAVDLSSSQLTRVCKARLGLSPLAWVREVRLEAARQLVVGSTLSMKQIAQRCGLGGPQSMNRLFHKRYGMSSTALRRGDDGVESTPNPQDDHTA